MCVCVQQHNNPQAATPFCVQTYVCVYAPESGNLSKLQSIKLIMTLGKTQLIGRLQEKRAYFLVNVDLN